MATTAATARVVASAYALADLNASCWLDTATRFSCLEIETIATLFRSVGRDELARQIVSAHAIGDEDGDSHYRGPKIDESVVRALLGPFRSVGS